MLHPSVIASGPPVSMQPPGLPKCPCESEAWHSRALRSCHLNAQLAPKLTLRSRNLQARNVELHETSNLARLRCFNLGADTVTSISSWRGCGSFWPCCRRWRGRKIKRARKSKFKFRRAVRKWLVWKLGCFLGKPVYGYQSTEGLLLEFSFLTLSGLFYGFLRSH